METSETLIDTLNDLIQINNDRITGYEKAKTEAKDIDVDLQRIFSKMADESRKYKSELGDEVSRLGGEIAIGNTGLGRIYQIWMDLKATFTGNDRQSVLNSCEYGEDAAQKAYADVLASDQEIEDATMQLIINQKADLQSSHDAIRKLRDANRYSHS